MRKEVNVNYQLEIVKECGEKVTEEFSQSFDHEIYHEDKEASDIMVISMKIQEMKEKHGDDIFIESFSVDRNNLVH